MTSEIALVDNKNANYGVPEKFGNKLFISRGSTPEKYTGLEYQSSFSFKYMFAGEESFIVEKTKKRIVTGQSMLVNDGSETRFLHSNGYAASIFLEPEILIDIHNTCVDQFTNLEYPFDSKKPSIELYDGVTNLNYRFIKKIHLALLMHKSPSITDEFYYDIAHEILCQNNDVYKKINSISSKNLATRKELFKRVDIVYQIVKSSLYSNINLNDLSRKSCLSKFHLIRTFKEVYGATPTKFFIKEKIKAAKEYYIRNRNNETLSSTALKFGYPDYPSFSKQFKAIEGYSPSLLKTATAIS